MANAFVEAHRRHGHDARLVTLCECENEFPEDVCLHLPMLQGNALHMALKRLVSRAHADRPKFERRGGVPEWRPRSAVEAALFRLREDVLWRPRIERAIREHRLDEFDVYHLESGVEFYRDGRFLRRMKSLGKRVVCYYLGTDLRDRGVIPAIRDLSDLNLTCEWDHLDLDPSLEYFFIPFDAGQFEWREPAVDRLRIAHAPRNRAVKGTDVLVAAVERARSRAPIELDVIEGVTHAEAMRRKRRCNLLVDQVGDHGATGYGMNSLEGFALGLPCMTSMTPSLARFLDPHPFLLVTPDTLEEKLVELAHDPSALAAHARRGREWVERTHSADRVVERIYEKYRERGWMDAAGHALAPGTSAP
jgi:hypothetical protein